MKLPTQAKPVPRVESKDALRGGVKPAGCCVSVAGQCIVSSPFC
jgi:hypothetical protein